MSEALKGFGNLIRCVYDPQEEKEPDEDAVENRLAKSNIIMLPNGTLSFATTWEENAEIPANVVGLLFKFGSLIGTSSDATSLNTSFDPSHVVFVPTEHIATYTAHASIPYFTETTGTFSTEDDLWNTWPGSGFDAAAGLGDICRYITSNGWVEGDWRLPRPHEIDEIIKLGSVATGPFTWEPLTNTDGPGTAQMSSGCFIGSSDTGPIEQPNEDVVFLPASGQRTSSGQWQLYGTEAAYWGASLKDDGGVGYNTLGNVFRVTSAGMGSNAGQQVMQGRPVRCIREKNGE